MQLILNIGLDGIPGAERRQADAALRALRAEGFNPSRATTFLSDSEPTLVVIAWFGNENGLSSTSLNVTWRQAVYHTARQLNQDCIAVYNPDTRAGYLIGPRAEAWGEFNAGFFIQIDGTRLA